MHTCVTTAAVVVMVHCGLVQYTEEFERHAILSTPTVYGGSRMPIVNVKVLAGAFSAEQKHAMIDEITEAMVKIGGEGMRPAIHVLVEDIPSGMWGIGGKRLTAEEIVRRRLQRTEKQ